MHVLLRQARIHDSHSGFHNKVVDLYIENGVIREIGNDLDAGSADRVIEGEDLRVSRGWVDVFADYSEPGYEHKETIASGLNAAAAGGFTQVMLAPNTYPVLDSKSPVQYVLQQAKGHIVTLRPLGAVSQKTEGKGLAEMLDMRAYGAVAFTDGWKPVQQASLMMKALEYVKAFDGTVIQVPADHSLTEGGLMHEGPVSTRLGMPGIPYLAETLMVHRDIELLRYSGSRLHLTGISSAVAVDMIRKAKAEGLNLTCSVTPYHLALTDGELSGYSSLYKVMPPLRGEEDRQALIEGLKDGTIDCIASHHRPQEWDAKEKEFEYAANGMNLQQIAFPVIWDTLKDRMDIDRLITALTETPRRIFGMDAPAIRKGAPAEMTIFTTSGETLLTNSSNHSRSINNPFAGRSLAGKVIGIISRGSVHLNP